MSSLSTNTSQANAPYTRLFTIPRGATIDPLPFRVGVSTYDKHDRRRAVPAAHAGLLHVLSGCRPVGLRACRAF